MKNEISKHFITPFLVFALLFPSVFQFSHLFEEHQHTVCNDYSVHFHETDTDCPICDFHLSSFNFEPRYNPPIAVALPYSKIDSFQEGLLQTIALQHPHLRGPPHFSY
ncbi:hypothetical protein [Altibacter sp.]|uniref:hypothetical protein n=1 Tax=Altibacter sp. TaxID=2024823 RepID=UPI002585F887|nr:hypothetical protein [Altibacter sp.]MCW8982253.1 hypothetical protein [Altibacter sp.]MCW9038058.1 hypothetical protein [Altibacter sp.]